MILLLDNYDSFTYNLFDYLQQLNEEVVVFRNDAVSIDAIATLQPAAIVISPGPKTPTEAGITMQLIKQFHQTTPILGICLGFQAIGEFFGAQLVKSRYPMHGKTSQVYHDGDVMFENIPNPFSAMRYHSLHLERINTEHFTITACTGDHVPMAFRHRHYPLCGVQFHPESILTPDGLQMLKNWKKMYVGNVVSEKDL